MWNIDEQSHIIRQILSDETFNDAIAGSVARAVAAAMKESR